jgi:Bacterial protein of unknown function (DUF894).
MDDMGAQASATVSVGRPQRLWNRDFALLWQGQLISSIGKQAFAITALLWLKDVTGSGSIIGMVMMAAMLPPVLLGPIAGVFVDRWDRRKIISYTDIAGGLFVLAAAALFFLVPGSKAALIGAVFAVTLATGLLDAFSQPSISASVPALVPAGKLEAANGLNMSGIQLAVFVSQGGSGLLYTILGAPLLVLANAVTYLYAGVSELFIRIPKLESRTEMEGPSAGEKPHPWHRFRLEFADGFSYLKGERGLLTLVLVYAVLNFLVSPLLVTLPFFASDYLSLGPAWYGYLMAAFGLGAVLGYLAAGIFPTRGRARELAVNASLVIQTLLTFATLVWKAPLAELGIFLAIGLTGGVMNVNINTIVQLSVPQEYMGRVQGIMTTICAGAMPLGMAVSGFLFDLSGQNVPLMFIASGASSLVAIAVALMVREYRSFLASR